MSFQHGLSGLNAASTYLDSIGNNVANSSTVGFKSGQTIFADVYANALSGAGGTSVGIGVKVAQVAQQFTQGNITTSNNTLDVAINGNGFFRMSDGGTITYTRNGQFQLDNGGYIINSTGSRLTGYMADAGGVLSVGAPTEININTSDLTPSPTTEVNAVLNLNSTQTVPTNSPFNPNDSTTFNSSTAVTVYDSLGNSHVLQTYFVKTSANEWDVYSVSDGVQLGATAVVPATSTAPVVAPGAPTSLTAIPANTFSINGVTISTAIAAGGTAAAQGANIAAAINLQTAATGVTATADGAGIITLDTTPTGGSITVALLGVGDDLADATANRATFLTQTGLSAAQVGSQAHTPVLGTLNFNASGALITALPITLGVPVWTGAATPIGISLDFSGTTQFGSAFSVNSLVQDGFTSGSLAGFTIGDDGMINGRYTNGQTATLGQVVLASFTNPNGLQPLGNNLWAETSTSGQPLVNAPGAGNSGVLQSNAVEDSNVDLTGELVNMITAQRYYQANAQTIKTQDEIMQTLVNL
ncbi:MAG: flagellar hook protein FlgE [Oxalobacter sp.]|nr:MAG: flagellar hook protein FlgE [Oxalobacter sp.]